MKVNLKESQLLTQLVENVSRMKGWYVADKEWLMLYQSLSESIYQFLSIAKSKEQKTALVFTDASVAHNFLLAAIIEYHKNDDNEEVGGNWSFVYSFYQQDIADCNIIYANEPQFLNVLNDVCDDWFRNQNGSITGFGLDPILVTEIMEYLISYLKLWLDTNARTDETVDIVLEDHFEASVAVEDGIKVMSMVPHGRAKSKIKNDDMVAEDVEQ